MENPEKAITRAVEECIEEGILADILSGQKAEVLELVLTTFNRELYEQGLKEDAAREAAEKAEKRGTKLGEDKLSQLVTALLDDGLVDVVRQVASDAKVREEYYKKYGIQ